MTRQAGESKVPFPCQAKGKQAWPCGSEHARPWSWPIVLAETTDGAALNSWRGTGPRHVSRLASTVCGNWGRFSPSCRQVEKLPFRRDGTLLIFGLVESR